ncbi:cytochrome P450 [Mycena maculata]|uniref:Cytochrome P450 n=1 Tax=Mycena maculata TaxID=230809 RepID=A0AAD7I074_9AGAR|nr:cytochrome P450 [Mycena maculata]
MAYNLSYGTASATLIAIVSLLLYLALRRGSNIGHIVGPPSPSWIFGNALELFLPSEYGDYEFKWQKVYGSLYRFKGCFGEDRLMVSDPLALKYLFNSPHVEHAPHWRNMFRMLYGEKSVLVSRGMLSSCCLYATLNKLVAIGQAHKRLRGALNSAFTAVAVREYQPMIERAAQQLAEELEKSSAQSVNVSPLLSDATLSAASEAILGYSLQELGEEFVVNNTRVLALSASQSRAQVLADGIGSYIPFWVFRMVARLPTTAFKAVHRVSYLGTQLGRKVVREKMNVVRQGLAADRDVYSFLLESEKTAKALSEEDLVAQTVILLIAGQDTTANTLSFGLLELARHPEFQARLRDEIRSRAGGDGVYDDMPLLNAFIKARYGLNRSDILLIIPQETLRLYPTLPIEERTAVEDVVVPLTESITTSNGESIPQIHIRKGTPITLGIASFQRLESLWGTDADEFKPSRWLEGNPYRGEVLGPYANLLSFGSGPHTCLGWRFAVLEMQVVLCELVSKFLFALPEDSSVRKCLAFTLIPMISTGEKGTFLRVSRIHEN